MENISSENPFAGLKFRYPWRPYQERVLKAIALHLNDKKLHVVAAPGAGKTTLGIESARLLGKPTLILSPTRSIRDQWIARFRDFFPDDTQWPPQWISSRLDKPAAVISITYQAFHSEYREEVEAEDHDEKDSGTEDAAPPGEKEIKELTKLLLQSGVGTLVLDEAHHLRTEWWKALSSIVKEIPDISIISLTATPPYDVTGSEWSKYQELCGPIDEEISVPELVKAGTLCPHQDYIWLVTPDQKEKDILREYDNAVSRLCSELQGDPVFRKAVITHPWCTSDAPNADEVLDMPATATAMLVFLNVTGEKLPRPLMRLLDASQEDLPGLKRNWWQELVRSYLFDSHWPQDGDIAAHREHLVKRLRAESLLYRRELRLTESRPVRQKLSLCPAKIRAVLEINRQEATLRGDDLRQVVLTDFIRDDDLGRNAGKTSLQLGAWPVFRELIQNIPADEHPFVGLLTGRVVVIHSTLLPKLKELAGDDTAETDMPAAPGFKRICASNEKLVAAFTSLLSSGHLRVIVGTRSLLGEGWDAPGLNSLILCSFVGTFMLTNQMRGRAIRINRNSPDKVASIWHLAAVDTGTPSGLSDIEDLKRRFETFVGLSARSLAIESGIDRMALDFIDKGLIVERRIDCPAGNRMMSERLKNIRGLLDAWNKAINEATEFRVLPGITTEKPEKVMPFHFFNTFKYLLYQALFAFLTGMGYVTQGARVDNLKVLLWMLIIGSGAGFIFALPKLIRAAYILIRHLPVDGAIYQIGLAVRDALCAAKLIENDPRRMSVETKVLDDGSCSILLTGAEFYEQALFADCMSEVLSPIENPRYLITRRSFSKHIGRIDYHAVPLVHGTTKERAEIFHAAWQKRVGPAELLYTRSPEARKDLLKARIRAFSHAAAASVKRVDKWH